MSCIFCKIINQEIPATVLWEDDDVLVFMDIGPIVKGHVLVIPKQHYDPVTKTPDDVVAQLHLVAKRVAQAQMDGLHADGVNIIQNNGKASGQEVPHLHIHVIPRFENDGHHWNWNPKKYTNVEEMNELAGRMLKQLQK